MNNKWQVKVDNDIVLITRNGGVMVYTPYRTMQVVVPTRILKEAKKAYDEVRYNYAS